MSKVNIFLAIICSGGVVLSVLEKNWTAAVWAATALIGVFHSETLESHIRLLTRKNR